MSGCRSSSSRNPERTIPWSSAISTRISVILADRTRGQGGGWRSADTPDPSDPGTPSTPGFLTRGVVDPRTHYYTRLFVDAAQAVAAARQHPASAGRPLVTTGGSQGGALAIVADRNNTLDRLLDEFPPLIKHFADTRDLFANAVEALGRASKAADAALAPSSNDLHTNLQLLHPALCELSKSSPYLFGALKLLLSLPFNVDTVSKFFRGDYLNGSGVIDLTLSAIDNAILSGTGWSGSLRALEQSWGRDPDTMIPDVRFTPNPHDAPNGPLVERGNGIC